LKQIDDGESWLLDAKRIATAQTARGPELAATTSIARLWQSQDKSAAAHALLFPVLRLVFRELRDRRSQGRQGTAGRAGTSLKSGGRARGRIGFARGL